MHELRHLRWTPIGQLLGAEAERHRRGQFATLVRERRDSEFVAFRDPMYGRMRARRAFGERSPNARSAESGRLRVACSAKTLTDAESVVHGKPVVPGSTRVSAHRSLTVRSPRGGTPTGSELPRHAQDARGSLLVGSACGPRRCASQRMFPRASTARGLLTPNSQARG